MASACPSRAGKTLGIVGESGCGKSMLSLSVMRLVPNRRAGSPRGGWCSTGQDVLALDALPPCAACAATASP